MKCPICKKEMVCMTPNHAKIHNLTMTEYRNIYEDKKGLTDHLYHKYDCKSYVYHCELNK